MFKIVRSVRHDDGDLVADFDVERDGITLTGCGIRRRADDLVILPPRGFSRPGTRTVWLSREARAALDDAGRRVAAELGLDGEDDAAGLRRALSAEAEACRIAGL